METYAYLQQMKEEPVKFLEDNAPLRAKCLEIASTLKTFDGDKMTTKELLGKAEELFNFINQK